MKTVIVSLTLLLSGCSFTEFFDLDQRKIDNLKVSWEHVRQDIEFSAREKRDELRAKLEAAKEKIKAAADAKGEELKARAAEARAALDEIKAQLEE